VTKLFVGNLSFAATTPELETLFAESGTVASVNIITDRFSGKSRGFGFVEMENARRSPGRHRTSQRERVPRPPSHCE